MGYRACSCTQHAPAALLQPHSRRVARHARQERGVYSRQNCRAASGDVVLALCPQQCTLPAIRYNGVPRTLGVSGCDPKLTRHQVEQLCLRLILSCGAPRALRDWACCSPQLGPHADQRQSGADSHRAQGGLQRVGAVLKDKIKQLLPQSQVPCTACTSAPVHSDCFLTAVRPHCCHAALRCRLHYCHAEKVQQPHLAHRLHNCRVDCLADRARVQHRHAGRPCEVSAVQMAHST